MSTIINLTQHPATETQKAVGVMDLPEEARREVQSLLTFEQLPTVKEMQKRAESLVEILKELKTSEDMVTRVMIGGAPFFMPILGQKLFEAGFDPVYAFTKRIVKEEEQEDGTVKKVSLFEHEGFVPHVAY